MQRMSVAFVPFIMAAGATPAAAATTLFQTTLDGALAVETPAVGSGSGVQIVTTPANDFVPALNGLGLRCDAPGERIYIPQAVGTTQNVELDHGTLTFFYQPDHAPNVNVKTSIIGTGLWGTPGTVHFGKHMAVNQYGLYLQAWTESGIKENYVAPQDYTWSAGQWLHVRITWDFTVAAGEQNVHLYFDDVEIPFTIKSTGPQTTAQESPSNYIYVGGRGPLGTIVPAGLYDDIEILNDVVPPPTSGSGGGTGDGGSSGSEGGANASSGASGGTAAVSGTGGSGSSTLPSDDDPGDDSGCAIASRRGQPGSLSLLALGAWLYRRRRTC